MEFVVTKPDAPGKRGRELQPPAVKTVAREAGIPVAQPDSKQALAESISEHPGVTHGVVVAYGMLVPRPVLEHFRNGLINVHASLLPRWRGPSPLESTILHGDTHAGISLIRLTEKMDAGPVYVHSGVELDGSETRLSLTDEMSTLGAESLHSHLPGILDGSVTPAEQDESRATYSTLLHKWAGEIDWYQPATMIERQIRAYLGWPGSHTTVNGTPVTVEATQVIGASGEPGTFESRNGTLVAYTTEDGLRIDQLRPTGGQSMSGDAFIRGYMRV